MFQVVSNHWEHIFFLLTNPNCGLGEVEKAMFQGVACHFELIYGLLTNPKCDLVEVGIAMFQMAHSTYFGPLD